MSRVEKYGFDVFNAQQWVYNSMMKNRISLSASVLLVFLSVAKAETAESIMEKLEVYQQAVEKALMQADEAKLKTLMPDEMAEEFIEDIREDEIKITQAEIFFDESSVRYTEKGLTVIGTSVFNFLTKDGKTGHEEQKVLYNFRFNDGVLKLEGADGVKNIQMQRAVAAGREAVKLYDAGQPEKMKLSLLEQGANEKDVEELLRILAENPKAKCTRDSVERKREGAVANFKIGDRSQSILFPWDE